MGCGAVGVGDELLAAEAVVAERAADGEVAAPFTVIASGTAGWKPGIARVASASTARTALRTVR